MFCPKCGVNVPDEAVFCPQCGEQLKDASANPQPQPNPQNPQQQPQPESAPQFQQPQQQPGMQPPPPPPYGFQPPYTPIQPQPQPQYGTQPPFNPMQNGAEYARPNPAVALKKKFSSGLFLAICILISSSVIIGFVGARFNIIGILFVISTWMIYSNSVSYGPVSRSGYVFSSVILKISRVFNWIAVGGTGIAAITLFACSAGSSFWQELIDELNYYSYSWDIIDRIGLKNYNDLISILNQFDGLTIGVVFAVLAIIMLVLCGFFIFKNLFFVNQAIRYSNAIVAAADSQSFMPSGKPVASRFLVIGIIEAVFSLQNLSSLYTGVHFAAIIASLCSAAALIIAYIMLKND